MARILVAGYHHETNTFAPSRAGWPAFLAGGGYPPYRRGASVIDTYTGVNMAIGGFIDEARRRGWTLLPSCWAGAMPSSYVSQEAFERIAGAILEDLEAARTDGGVDAIYLDLHGAACAEHAPDSEGELLRRLRARVGPELPIVASLDLHANVTPAMLALADAMVAYRTYPHVDMAATGERAAGLLAERMRRGQRHAQAVVRLPYLIPLNAQGTDTEPAGSVYRLIESLESRHGVVASFCPGFPAADFDGCGPVLWAHGPEAGALPAALEALRTVADRPSSWRIELPAAADAVAEALARADGARGPVLIADTQDNPGAGGDANTTGLLRALLAAGAGRRLPGRVALGLLCDPEAARAAHAAGAGAELSLSLGRSVPTADGSSSEPAVHARVKVLALSDGRVTLQGPMMRGVALELGPTACVEVDGVRVALSAGKCQMLDRALFRLVGIEPERMALLVLKSSIHFRADFLPIASHVIVARAPGPMAADPGSLPWRHLSPAVRPRP